MNLLHFLLLISSTYLFIIVSADYDFPPYQIEVYEPKGFKISIPDSEGVTLFAVHININKEMEFLEAGQIARDVVKKRGDRWVYEDKNLRLKRGDKLYFWLYVIFEKLGYRLDDQEYTVKDFTPKGGIPAAPPTHIDPTPPIRPDIETCQTSTTITSDKRVCRDKVFYFEQFTERVIPGGTIKKWATEVQIPRTSESLFVVYDNKNVKVENGQLIIQPTLLEDTYGDITTQQLTLNGCTSEVKDKCEATAFAWNILPPILSSRVTTRDSFSFKYGILEVKAKLPQGDWIVPEIWLVAKNQGPSPVRLTLARSLGNTDLTIDGNRIGGQKLSQGIVRNITNSLLFSKERNNLWSDDYHVYKLHWTPEYTRFLVDDSEVGRFDRLPINSECYISIGVHVGGAEDFPDDSINRGNYKPWKNNDIKNSVNFWEARNTWYPSWNDKSKLMIDYIRVTAL